jgi:hypothetical protein
MNKNRIRINIRTKTQKEFMKKITKESGTKSLKEERAQHKETRIYYYFIKYKREGEIWF